MSSLSAIKFRHLFDQLNITECNRLLSKLITNYGKDFIGLLLFNSWSPNAKSIMSDEDMANIVQITSDILRARKNQTNEDKIDKIDKLTDHLIGEIGSYLHQDDYAKFSETNRCVYIGCHSPNRLQTLFLADEDQFEDDHYSAHNLSHYPSLKTLDIYLERFAEFKLPSEGKLILNHLTNISLAGNEGEPMVDITPFMTQKCINFDRIEMVSLYLMNNTNAFWELMLKFKDKNIKRLQLSDIDVEVMLSDQKIKNLFPNLEQFSFSGGSHVLGQKFMELYGYNLKHLDLCSGEGLNFESINFEKLNEFVLTLPTEQTLDNIMKTATALKKWKINFEWTELNCVQQIIAKVISTKNELECVEFIGRGHEGNINILEDIFGGIEQGLLMTKQTKRKIFKIGITYYHENSANKLDIGQLLLFISRMKDKLQSSTINDYTFFCKFKGWNVDRNELDEAVKEVQQFESEIIIRCVDNGTCIVLMNKDCKINGYSISFSKYYSW